MVSLPASPDFVDAEAAQQAIVSGAAEHQIGTGMGIHIVVAPAGIDRVRRGEAEDMIGPGAGRRNVGVAAFVAIPELARSGSHLPKCWASALQTSRVAPIRL